MIRHLICGNNYIWLVNLNMTHEKLNWAWKWLVDLNARKLQLVSFHRCNSSGAIDVKMNGSVLMEKSSIKMLQLSFSTKLDQGSYIISIAKNVPKKIGALIHCVVSFSWGSHLSLQIYHTDLHGILLSRLGWCLQKQECRIVGSTFATSLEPFGYLKNIATSSLL